MELSIESGSISLSTVCSRRTKTGTNTHDNSTDRCVGWDRQILPLRPSTYFRTKPHNFLAKIETIFAANNRSLRLSVQEQRDLT